MYILILYLCYILFMDQKRVFDDLVLKAKAQKEDILSFDDSMIQDDMVSRKIILVIY